MPQTPIFTPNIAAYGAKNAPNLTVATLVKGARGTLLGLQVIVAGSAPGSVNDSATIAGAATANEIAVIPNSVGGVSIAANGIACVNGIVVTPGTGQTVVAIYI